MIFATVFSDKIDTPPEDSGKLKQVIPGPGGGMMLYVSQNDCSICFNGYTCIILDIVYRLNKVS